MRSLLYDNFAIVQGLPRRLAQRCFGTVLTLWQGLKNPSLSAGIKAGVGVGYAKDPRAGFVDPRDECAFVTHVLKRFDIGDGLVSQFVTTSGPSRPTNGQRYSYGATNAHPLQN